MLVPSLLFGTARDVRANIGKISTRLKRGESLESILESSNKVDLTEHPESLVWIERAFVLRAGDEPDFRAAVFTNEIFDATRIPFERSNAIREESVDYLCRSPWGCVVLNSGQPSYWYAGLPLRPLRPSRRGHVATLMGTLRHWDALMSLGARYYSGGAGAETFPRTLPAYGSLLAQYGLDPRASESGSGWRELPLLCDMSFVDRIRFDDEYWNELVRKWRSAAGTPDLVLENLAEITSLCESGSWSKSQWEFLEMHGGAEAVEGALKVIEARSDWAKLIGVLVHALGDMERAAKLFAAHEANNPEIHWAAGRIAQYLAHRDPERAAKLFFRSVEGPVGVGGDSRYRTSVLTLKEARTTLVEADLAHVWKRQLADFRAVHRRRKSLMAMLTEEFPEDET